MKVKMNSKDMIMLVIAGALVYEPVHAACQFEHVPETEHSKPPVPCQYVETGGGGGLNRHNGFTVLISGCP
jgi:hypothetical protein